jgi:hypothetical protein
MSRKSKRCRIPDENGGALCPVMVVIGESGCAATQEPVSDCQHLGNGVFCPYYRYITKSRKMQQANGGTGSMKKPKRWWEFWK